MKSLVQACFILPLAAIAAAADEIVANNACREVFFTVSGTALNRNITGIPLDQGLAPIVEFYQNAPLIEISGPQTIAATFCNPTTQNSNNKKLQMLFGSITISRSGWSALGGIGTGFQAFNPALYSWVQYANAQGYPTLAIDRLGTGKSSHPDPILVVQAPYEMALYNDLARQVRGGSSQLPSAYTHLIYIGNSYGSQLGTGIAGQYPDAYTEFILTGFTNSVQKGFAGVSLVLAAPAQVVDPARFGSLPMGYLTTSNQTGRTNSFFGSKAQVLFEDIVARLFYDRKDVVSVGQFVSVYAYPFSGGGFPGRVLNLIGEQDQPFCGPGSPVLGPATCGLQTRDTGVLFPAAKYNWKSVDKVGHAVQLHIRSRTVFQVAHRFLAGESFNGGPPA